MAWLKHVLIKWLVRDFTRQTGNDKIMLEKIEQDSLLSAMWQNQAFRKYINARNSALVISMADNLKMPSDAEYLVLYGRRLELLNLHNEAKLGYNRRAKKPVTRP